MNKLLNFTLIHFTLTLIATLLIQSGYRIDDGWMDDF